MHKLQEGDNPEGNKQHITDTGTDHYNQSLNNLQSSVLTHAPLVPRHDQDTGSPSSKTYDSPHSQNYVTPHSQTNFPTHSQTYVPPYPHANLPPHPQTNVPPNSQTYVPPTHALTRDPGVMMRWADYKRLCDENGSIITTQDNRTYYDL